MTNTNGAYVVSWDFTRGKDVGVLIVGKQHDKKIDIVNAFQGQEAYDIYEKLSTVKKKDA
jgi:hypothetical protein